MDSYKLMPVDPLSSENFQSLYVDENYRIVKHESGIYFSFARRGDAVMAHFSSKKEYLRNVKNAIEDFCAWAFYMMPWATMVMATIERPSVVRLVKKCGFNFVCKAEDCDIYARLK